MQVKQEGDIGYDPRKSKVSDDTMAKWRQEPITGDLLEVPGIGPATVKVLAEGDEKITNTYQLFGKFMMLKGPDSEEHKIESVEHCEKFWFYLQARGVKSNRSAIVKSLAEKAATFFRGIYDANEYASDSDEE